jgi:hypothetical protein
LIPGRGLLGAALAIGISSAAQFAGLLFLFLRLISKGRDVAVAIVKDAIVEDAMVEERLVEEVNA